jgi:long-subunit fatty acid transport protein
VACLEIGLKTCSGRGIVDSDQAIRNVSYYMIGLTFKINNNRAKSACYRAAMAHDNPEASKRQGVLGAIHLLKIDRGQFFVDGKVPFPSVLHYGHYKATKEATDFGSFQTFF